MWASFKWLLESRANAIFGTFFFFGVQFNTGQRTSWRNYACKFCILSTWHMVNSNRKMTAFFLLKYQHSFFLFSVCHYARKKKERMREKKQYSANASTFIAICNGQNYWVQLSHLLPHQIERECIEFSPSAVSSSKSVCQIFYSHQV